MKNTSILIPIILISCLGALGYLFYEAMQTVEGDRPRTSTPIVLNQDDYSDDDIPADIGKSTEYDTSTNDGFRELTPAEREEAHRQSKLDEDREAADAEAARKREAQLSSDAAEAARKERERKAQAANSTSTGNGRYLIIAGSFRQKVNAQQRIKDLRTAGFKDTRLEKFNRGTFAVALAGQTDRFSSAEQLAAKIVGAGFEAKVMRRR